METMRRTETLFDSLGIEYEKITVPKYLRYATEMQDRRLKNTYNSGEE